MQRYLSAVRIFAFFCVCFLLTAPGARAVGGPLNPSFELRLESWLIDNPLGGGEVKVTTGYPDAFVVNPTFKAVDGRFFGVVSGGERDLYVRLTTLRFFAVAGQKLTGWSFFLTNDAYIETQDGQVFNDDGQVVVLPPAGDPVFVYNVSVKDIGDSNRTDWTRWEYTIPTTGYYQVRAQVVNRGDSFLPSAVGLDALLLGEIPASNRPPSLAAIPDQTVNEETPLSFTAVATDLDSLDVLTYTVEGDVPEGAHIDPGTGAFTWTPTEAQGPGSYTFLVVVRDNGEPVLGDAKAVTVTVGETNKAPTPPVVGSPPTSVAEGTPVTFTATASDPDVPANKLTYSLVGAPAGASIDPTTGAFSWTPSEAQGPGTYPFTVRVTDDGTPALLAETPVAITVTEVNAAPVLAAIGDKTVVEDTPLTFTATADDPDLPNDKLTYSLAGAPAGAAIDPNTGAFSWTPGEDRGPGSYTFTVIVTDAGNPALSDQEQIQVLVEEDNKAPVLAAIGSKTVDEGKALAFTATASDPDVPANKLTYSLVGAPAGASIDPTTGAFSWTPSEAQGPGTYPFTVRVTDDGTPARSDEKPVTVTVNDVNNAPVLAAIGNKTVDEEKAFTFTATASDPDQPADKLTYSLTGAPTGAAIDADTGKFSWTPSETQGPGSYTFTVGVADSGAPSLSDQEQITITVAEVNKAPILAPIGGSLTSGGGGSVSTGLTAAWGQPFTFTATASDSDQPTNKLTYSLIGAPTGAAIDADTGKFSWTPAVVGSFTFRVVVTDNGQPTPLSDEKVVTIQASGGGASAIRFVDPLPLEVQTSDVARLSARLVDSVNNPLGGFAVTFRLGALSATATTNASGLAQADLRVGGAPGSQTASVSFGGSATYQSSSDATRTVKVLPEDARVTDPQPLLVSTGSVGSTRAQVTLATTILDITALPGDIAYDPFPGNIAGARVSFVNRETGRDIASGLAVTLKQTTEPKVGTATYTATVDIGNILGQTYIVGTRVEGNYTRDAAQDNTLITVFRPLTDSLVGGGYLVNEKSAGRFPGEVGQKTHFGMAVKFAFNAKDRLTGWSGYAAFLVRSGGKVYLARTTSIDALEVPKKKDKADFEGPAAIWDITDPKNPVLKDGNAWIVVSVTDEDRPGRLDTLAVTVLDSEGGVLYFSSNGNKRKANPQDLAAGQVQIR